MRTFPLWSRCLHSEQGPRASCSPQHSLHLMDPQTAAAAEHRAAGSQGSCRGAGPACPALPLPFPSTRRSWQGSGYVGGQCFCWGRGEPEPRDPRCGRGQGAAAAVTHSGSCGAGGTWCNSLPESAGCRNCPVPTPTARGRVTASCPGPAPCRVWGASLPWHPREQRSSHPGGWLRAALLGQSRTSSEPQPQLTGQRGGRAPNHCPCHEHPTSAP